MTKPDPHEALVELGAIAIYGCYNPALDWNYPGHRAAKAECRTFARAVIAAIRREAIEKWPTEEEGIMMVKRVADMSEEIEVVVASIHLKSGRFQSSVELPLNCSETEKRRFIEAWLALMAAGLKCVPPQQEDGK